MGLHYALATYLARLNDWYLPVYIGWGIAMLMVRAFPRMKRKQ